MTRARRPAPVRSEVSRFAFWAINVVFVWTLFLVMVAP